MARVETAAPSLHVGQPSILTDAVPQILPEAADGALLLSGEPWIPLDQHGLKRLETPSFTTGLCKTFSCTLATTASYACWCMRAVLQRAS